MDGAAAARFQAAARLGMELMQARSMGARLDAIEAAEATQPGTCEAFLADADEGRVMLNELLKLLKVWGHHVRGEEAEREYYLCALRAADERREVRRRLGLERRWAAQRLVFLITVDCLRADRLSCNGHDRPTSPAIDALAAEGVNFSRAYSTANDTAQSFPSILLSNFFRNLGGGIVVPGHLTTLAEALRGNGFYTVGLNAANPMVSHYCGYDRGFDEFSDFFVSDEPDAAGRTPVRSLKRLKAVSEGAMRAVVAECEARPDLYALLQRLTSLRGLELVRRIAGDKDMAGYYDAAEVVKAALASLLACGHRRDIFCWMHLMDAHEPITVPFSRLGRFARVERFFLNRCVQSARAGDLRRVHGARYRELYDCAVSYVDLNVEVLRTFLEDHGLLGRSLVCLTGDHGQELLEDGAFGHGSRRVVEALLHVPLVFGGGLATRLDRAGAGRPVSSLDVAPTILDLCGVGEAPRSFLGTSLNDVRPRPAYVECMAVANPWDAQRNGFYLGLNGGAVLGGPRVIACVEGHHILVHRIDTGETRLERSGGARGAPDEGEPPDGEEMLRRTKAYFERIHVPAEGACVRQASAREKDVVVQRLKDLGYL